MNLKLNHISNINTTTLQITGSKSETNRLLILQALYREIQIENISNSDDSQLMQTALASDEELIDIHHAGTAMRFLTAYFAVQNGRKTILTGSKRMQERPIKVLVDALRQLGCDISYEKEEGYPPIKIIGKKPTINKVSLAANISSQYISALMLIASSLPNGLEISLQGKVTSVPYIKMTLSLLKDVGIDGSFDGNTITIDPVKSITTKKVTVESDWSSASYFYSIVALSDNKNVTIGSYKNESYQGDSALDQIYKQMGVETTYDKNTITLSQIPIPNDDEVLELDLSNAPDIAQTIAVTCFGLGKGCYLTGLHTLKIKETDRLEALKAEIEKLGGEVTITEDTLRLAPSSSIKSEVSIATYKDHRMAMAFAPLALRTAMYIQEADVVSKSYPDFWSDLKKLGFKVS
ncbi:3-phosphoshikimate 1-carboxyvinyltransferase [Aquimarina sp. 2201CG14-23]|uniref:3-phosphoshikimate 1-carboxyvinyltransferase n=1 Tax=Aquimarina mycalae TaxID=3040073 RepID=UPI002478057C|nr:3-phosphoshikimate 1-carboxyvinyltransferase [Aquimarina sp. 2201CG14-23]MDH7445193.1 3-phosphoshikimate 1-carboxyvinyltransferase [Aquimarina sp. 2201CG14-23]